jgi:hypothetical protein
MQNSRIRICIALGFSLGSVVQFAACASGPPASPEARAQALGANVILITVDGLRNEESFGGIDAQVLENAEHSGIEYLWR